MRGRLPLCLALLSGACVLVYEIVWMRAFTPAFGLSVHATTAVLCAFMGGLGLGSQLAPRVLGRWGGSGWSLYEVIELVIAATALLVPLAIAPITAAYASLVDLDSGGLFTAALRFVLAVAALIAPTFLMGVSFPLMGRLYKARGGGTAYYNSPLRSTFTQLWCERGLPPEGADPPRFFAERHQDRVDRSLRRFASGFPEEVLRRIEARNGSR